MSLQKYLFLGASALSMASPMAAFAQNADSEPSVRANDPNEIIVSATRRDESILDTSLSITAYSQADLDTKGVRSIEDLVRMTPGVSLNQGALGIRYLVIRGLTSSVGATMNAVYIDDTPVQVRSVSITTNFYPGIFDLERVEILRGPQGTLFGAGAMGGAIRYITTKASLNDYSGYARAEIGFTEGGDPSYEAGAAVGGPIIQDKLGFRISGYHRRDGGYIDRVPYALNWGTARENHNTRENYVGQASLLFQPSEGILITPSVFYQQADRTNTDEFWRARPANLGGTPPAPVPLPAPVPPFTPGASGDGIETFGRDTSILYAIKGEFDMGPVTIVSNTSWLDRDVKSRDDGTAFFRDLLGQPQRGGLFQTLFGTDYRSSINLRMRQDSFTQELRVQSNPSDSPLSYVAGLFFQNSRQRAVEFDIAANPAGLAGLIPQVNGNIGYGNDFARDRQFGVFGNVDYKLTDTLSINAGLRYSYLTFDFLQKSGNNLPSDSIVQGRTTENPLTPKFGIDYEPTDNLLFYASASKGFRPGGTNPRPDLSTVSPDCLSSLAAIGYPAGPPTEYNSDSVWSYEIGAKGRIGSWLTFAGDIFRLDWTNQQTTRAVLNCANPFIDNIGSSRAQGVEAKITLTPVTGLTLDGNFSYTDATVQETRLNPAGTATVVTKGDRFAPEWIISVSADYETPVSGDTVGYGRVQWDHRSGYDVSRRNAPVHPLNYRIFERDYVAARVGVRTGGMDLSLFVNNLLNSKDELGRLVLGGGQANRYTVQTYRPRTIGATASYRF